MDKTRIRNCFIGYFLLIGFFCNKLRAQEATIHDVPTFTGIFPSYRIGDNWGVVGDLLINRNNLYADPGFIWLKVAPAYWSSNGPYFFSAGLALVRNPRFDLTNATHTMEYRFDPQALWWKPLGKGTFSTRFRLDFRSRQNIENNELVGTRNMSYRFRYFFSYTFPISKGERPVSLVLANEVLVQFGEKIVYNTFDQMRFFIGVHRRVSKEVAFDFGYFPIYSQTSAGNVYTLNHIIRLFIFIDFMGKKNLLIPSLQEGIGDI